MNEIKTTEESIHEAKKSMRKASTQMIKDSSTAAEDIAQLSHSSHFEKFKSIGEVKMKVNFKHRKQSIVNRQLSLRNLVDLLEEAIEALKILKDEDVVLVLGNTGSGKSTMLSSLIYGPDTLEEKV